MENKICCICKKEIKGWGNNPWGALDEKEEYIEWKNEDYCCDECNDNVVFPGRLKKFYAIKQESKTTKNWENSNENIKCKEH